MADETFRVRPFYRLVANGHDGSHLKATLIITPEPAMNASDGFPLESWPSKITQILRGTELGHAPKTGEPPAHLRPNIELRIGRPDADPIKPATIDFIGHGSSMDADWTHVTALWKKALLEAAVFVRPDGTRIVLPKPWDALGADIKQSLTGGKHAADPKDLYQGETGGGTPTVEKFDYNGAIVARRPSPSEKITVVGVVANGQSDLALDEERVRAQRVLRKMVAGPGLPGDDAAPSDELPPDEPPPGYTTNPEENEKRFKAAVRNRVFSDFMQTVAETNDGRARTRQQFTEIKKILEKKTEGTPVAVASHKVSGLQPVAPANRVAEGQGGRSLRAGHAYGGWLQSVKKNEEVSAETPYRAYATAALTADQATALEQMRGVYYSLQGDAFLSRLFCLTVDVRLSCPTELANAPGSVFVYLAAEHCKEKRLTAQVMTAAKYDRSRFWPVSRFEVSDANVDVKSLVEQEAGLWKLGSGYGTGDTHNPRYDLTSLDYRRSVDATHDAIDRGQRQITAGFTILDRGRGEQIARDLAISAVQSVQVCDQAQSQCNVENRHCVILWAEELTIGRRLDVAVVKDSSTLSTLEWRALMHRQTEFEVDPAVARILKQVTHPSRDNNWFDEETSFQVVTRSMPLLGNADDSDRSVEAIADEALVMWDGTPLAALVHPGSDTPGSGSLRLPFTRRHHLGTSGHRPPPLRYGVGYAFSMRSVFLGGGSPPVEALKTAHRASNGQMMLPPAVQSAGQYVPARTRFLRHEGIDAPQVLIPRHLADVRHGLMGFEISDRAVVRQAVRPAQPATVSTPETPDRYVSLDERSQPNRSMRVFVAPIAPLETVIRHRELDEDGMAAIRGGLQTVLFDPAKDGFPVAHTLDAAEFNGDRALVRREIVQNETRLDPKKKKSGAAVFTAGGKNQTPAGGIGYLPDPAAEIMVVRVRVRGSDRYLGGAFVTGIYDEKREICYPHALPLAVSIEKQDQLRDKQAEKVSEILHGDATAVVTLTREGRIVAGISGGGTKVRHVTVRLAPGEDFDLEVTCLPKIDTLAQCFALPETMALQLRHTTVDACAADDLSCLCGPAATARLAALRKAVTELDATHAPKVRGLGGWPVPALPAIKAVAKELIDTMQSRWQIEELAAVQQLRVCHAINAPLTAPQVALTGVNRPLVKDGAKRTEIAAGPNAQGAQAAVLQGKVKIDLEQIDAFEIVVTTAPTGAKAFDDKNRSRSLLARRAGRWPEVLMSGGRSHYVATQDVLGFTVATNGRVTLPSESVTLLRVGNLPDPRAVPIGQDSIFTSGTGRLTEIDLGALHAAGLAKAAIDIPVATDALTTCDRTRKITTDCPLKLEDTRARKMKVKLIGISRSSPLFQTTAFYAGSDNSLKQRQGLAPAHQVHSSVETELWVKSTIRPSRCDARPPTATFQFERSASEDRNLHRYFQSLTRTAKTRLHFGRGMFDSGEGERIGIVLWPPAYKTQDSANMAENRIKLKDRMLTLAELNDADLGPGGKFVTRWGGDPIRKDIAPQTGNFIPVKEFIDLNEKSEGPHWPIYVASAQMPVHVSENVDPATGKVIPDPNAKPEFLEVSLVTYEPCFDIDREEWYIDVNLHPALATDPFVRFGLVRYQEQCIDELLKVSEPVSVWTQLLPQRIVSVEHWHKDGNVYMKASVRGQASAGSKPIEVRDLPPLTPLQEAARRSIELPVMQMTIVHEGSANGIVTRTPVWQHPPIEERPSPDNGLMQWKFDEKLIEADRLRELGHGRLVAYFEEIERRMPATYAKEPISAGEMLSGETIVSSGPRFSARVVFSEA